jgi:PPOX class probable F420-dependent enzyme
VVPKGAWSALEPWAVELVRTARVGRLGTASAGGAPLVVPVCFAWIEGDDGDDGPFVVSAIDAKPKSTGQLRRVRDVAENPRAALLVDVWDEDWRQLAWVRVDGAARLLLPGGAEEDRRLGALHALEAKYPQYKDLPLDVASPVIALVPERLRAWRYTAAGA